MALDFQKLIIKNFLSVGSVEQTISLDRKGLTLILGENLDQPQGENSARNGVGKTTLINAINYALFGSAVSKIKRIGNLINNINNKNCLVILEFNKDGHFYRIERGQKPKIFRWIVDGQLIASDDSEELKKEGDQRGNSRDTQAEIIKIVGLEETMFKHIVAMNTYTKAFLEEGPAEQREVIEQILGIKILSEKGEALMDMMRHTKKLIEDEETKIDAIKAANERLQRSIDDLQLKATHWSVERQEKMNDLITNLKAFEGIDFDAEVKAFDDQDAYDRAMQTLTQEKKSLDQEISMLQTQATSLMADIENLQKNTGDNPQIARLEAELARYKKDLNDNEANFGNQIGRVEVQSGHAVKEIYTRSDASVKRLKEELTTLSLKTTDRIRQLKDDLITAERELADPDTKNCKSCGQPLKDGDHLHEVVGRIEQKILTITKNIETEKAKLTEHDQRIAAEIETVQTKAISDVAELELRTKETVKKLRETATENETDLTKKISEVSTQIEQVNADFETEKKAATTKLEDKQKTLEMMAGTLSSKLDMLSTKESEIAALGDRPQTMFPQRDDAYQAKQLFEQMNRDLKIEQDKKNPYNEQIETISGNLQPPKYDKLNEETRKLTHQKFLRELLIDKKSFIRKKIIDQNLTYLNTRLSHYLTKVGMTHQVLFNNDLSADITQYGKDLDIGNLSRGESTRLSVSLSWAFRDMWENLNGPINLLLVDEILDAGLDSQGTEYSFEVLTDMVRTRGKSVFLITHKDDLHSRANNVIIARKENKFTTFDDQTSVSK